MLPEQTAPGPRTGGEESLNGSRAVQEALVSLQGVLGTLVEVLSKDSLAQIKASVFARSVPFGVKTSEVRAAVDAATAFVESGRLDGNMVEADHGNTTGDKADTMGRALDDLVAKTNLSCDSERARKQFCYGAREHFEELCELSLRLMQWGFRPEGQFRGSVSGSVTSPGDGAHPCRTARPVPGRRPIVQHYKLQKAAQTKNAARRQRRHNLSALLRSSPLVGDTKQRLREILRHCVETRRERKKAASRRARMRARARRWHDEARGLLSRKAGATKKSPKERSSRAAAREAARKAALEEEQRWKDDDDPEQPRKKRHLPENVEDIDIFAGHYVTSEDEVPSSRVVAGAGSAQDAGAADKALDDAFRSVGASGVLGAGREESQSSGPPRQIAGRGASTIAAKEIRCRLDFPKLRYTLNAETMVYRRVIFLKKIAGGEEGGEEGAVQQGLEDSGSILERFHDTVSKWWDLEEWEIGTGEIVGGVASRQMWKRVVEERQEPSDNALEEKALDDDVEMDLPEDQKVAVESNGAVEQEQVSFGAAPVMEQESTAVLVTTGEEDAVVHEELAPAIWEEDVGESDADSVRVRVAELLDCDGAGVVADHDHISEAIWKTILADAEPTRETIMATTDASVRWRLVLRRFENLCAAQGLVWGGRGGGGEQTSRRQKAYAAIHDSRHHGLVIVEQTYRGTDIEERVLAKIHPHLGWMEWDEFMGNSHWKFGCLRFLLVSSQETT